MLALSAFNDTEYTLVSPGPNAVPFSAELVPTTDVRYLPPQLGLFANRHDPAANIADLDREIANRFKTNFTALMYHLDLETGAEKFGANHSILLKAISLQIIRPVFERRHALELEDELFIFYEPADAVLAALEAKAAVAHYNANLPAERKDDRALDIEGWGIHNGTMIFVEGTDIHWGDPVNTASKLGQDLATGGDLLVTKTVHDLAEARQEIQDANIAFEFRMLKRSGVDLPCFCVTTAGAGGAEAEGTKTE